jgi:hypothetical protein
MLPQEATVMGAHTGDLTELRVVLTRDAFRGGVMCCLNGSKTCLSREIKVPHVAETSGLCVLGVAVRLSDTIARGGLERVTLSPTSPASLTARQTAAYTQNAETGKRYG